MEDAALLVLEEEAALEVDVSDPEADEDPEDFIPAEEVDLDSLTVPVEVIASVETEPDETGLEELTDPENAVSVGEAFVVEDPVIMAVRGEVVVVPILVVEETAAAEPSLNPGKKLGEYVAVPEYSGQPGTVVIGGAIPPPQSRKEHISPVPGTYQSTLAPP